MARASGECVHRVFTYSARPNPPSFINLMEKKKRLSIIGGSRDGIITCESSPPAEAC